MRKIISLSLALVMLMSIMTGCGTAPSIEEPLPNEPKNARKRRTTERGLFKHRD